MKVIRYSLVLWFIFSANLAADIQVTDLAGRDVTLENPAERYVMSEGRYITTLGMLRPENPVRGLLGMLSPVSWSNPMLERQLFKKFPEAKEIALFGGKDESSVSVEKIIDLNPELAIFGVQDHGPSSKNAELISQLTAAGIKIVFIDFRMDPLNNTTKSIELLGKVLGAEKNAQKYIEFYTHKLNVIKAKIDTATTRPTVFLQAHAGRFPCCLGMADGMLGPFIEAVGGDNIADKVAPGPTSQHTAEFLLVKDPDVWITTASGTVDEFKLGKTPVATGPGMSVAMAEESLENYLKTPEFAALSAVKNGRAHSVWHSFYNSPLNIVAVQAFAKWIHPELFDDLNPQSTMQEIFDTFMPFELEGVYTATNRSQ